jgi:hypothetical protein
MTNNTGHAIHARAPDQDYLFRLHDKLSRELGPEVCRRKRHRDSDERAQKKAHLSGTPSPPLLALNLAVSAGGAIVFVNAVYQSSDALTHLSIPTSAAL